MNRRTDFNAIKRAISSSLRVATPKALLAEGDSLKLLKLLPSHCISLILTDPPYHSTKKDNVFGDTLFKHDKDYLAWMGEFAKEWHRVLKPNGSLYCFCAPEMAARLEVVIARDFNVLSQITWTKPNEPGFDGWKQKMKKESLRQWYAHTERIIFAEPAYEGNLFKSYFGNMLREMRLKANMTTYQLAEVIGAYGKVNHGGAVANWEAGRNVPSVEQYEKICDAILKTGKVKNMPPYRDAIRTFKVDSSIEFTDVWNFPSVRPYKTKHPAEKPLNLLDHAIKATTYPGDIVLDCFGGSGSTAFAATKIGRLSVTMEIDPVWVRCIASQLDLGNHHQHLRRPLHSGTVIQRANELELSLISA
ncbi:MAG TPA: site-specific DNA-methyltransferase [Elusimicrobiota bacterium]|nr:site-specific DNA-methyltransferase [Elusimicrobiota bacterium]